MADRPLPSWEALGTLAQNEPLSWVKGGDTGPQPVSVTPSLTTLELRTAHNPSDQLNTPWSSFWQKYKTIKMAFEFTQGFHFL